ncbi:MAG: LptF/LptG family permease, partial [Noviherbaspirillum sp.]
MIFQRALRRELVSTAGAVFTTLFTITITVMLIKILGQAAGGRVASQDVIALIGFAALRYLPIILILTSFIAVLVVVTRSYQDSEMVVWFASGLSLSRWIKPILAFGTPIVVLIAALSFFVTPWANRQSAEFRERFEKREDISKVSPGKFQESSSADRIFFVEA